jgi:hypothetical protein
VVGVVLVTTVPRLLPAQVLTYDVHDCSYMYVADIFGKVREDSDGLGLKSHHLCTPMMVGYLWHGCTLAFPRRVIVFHCVWRITGKALGRRRRLH